MIRIFLATVAVNTHVLFRMFSGEHREVRFYSRRFIWVGRVVFRPLVTSVIMCECGKVFYTAPEIKTDGN